MKKLMTYSLILPLLMLGGHAWAKDSHGNDGHKNAGSSKEHRRHERKEHHKEDKKEKHCASDH